MKRAALLLLLGCLFLSSCMEAPGLSLEIDPSPTAQAVLRPSPTASPSKEAAESPSPAASPSKEAAESPSPAASPSKEAAESPSPAASPSREAEPEAESLPLAGVAIGLDPGHQAHSNKTPEPVAPGSSQTKKSVSSGTQGSWSGTPEYEVVLAVGLKLRQLLEEKGATVYMTRETNEVNISNMERAHMMNELGVDLVLRLHCDGSEDPEKHGSSMLVPSNDCTQAINAESERAGEILQKAYIEATGLHDRGLKYREDMSGFNHSTVPVVLSEMCYMTNEEEDALINTEDFQQTCAEGLCQGILNYIAQRDEA